MRKISEKVVQKIKIHKLCTQQFSECLSIDQFMRKKC